MTWLVFFVFAIFAVSAERRRFDGCEVWQVNPTNSGHLKQLHTLSKLHESQKDQSIVFYDAPGNLISEVEVLVCKSGIQKFKNFLRETGMPAEIISENLQMELDALWARSDTRHRGGIANYVDDDYNTFEDIISQLDVLQGNCPGGFTCIVETIGQSVEGRPIYILRIEKPGDNRRGIYLDSLTHAREWISGATVMGILSRLINEYGTNPEATRLVDTYDFHVVPVVNPDGYVYTWTDERFWRKNKSFNLGATCNGTDLNRNFDYSWGEPGSSPQPCSDGYHGPEPASEPETQAVQGAGEALRGRLVLWLTFHNFGEQYLFPYGTQEGSACRLSPDHDDLNRAGQAAAQAARETNNGNWVSGTPCQILGLVAGSTQDWAYGTGIVKYSYTPELRGPGFTPDRTNIQPSVEENWSALNALLDVIEDIEGY